MSPEGSEPYLVGTKSANTHTSGPSLCCVDSHSLVSLLRISLSNETLSFIGLSPYIHNC
jgi:hypothetical protein